jgi:hypothetical protein
VARLTGKRPELDIRTGLMENEPSHGKPRGIKDRHPQELRSKPRFSPLPSMEEAGEAPHFVIDHVPELPRDMFTPGGQVRGIHHPAKAG